MTTLTTPLDAYLEKLKAAGEKATPDWSARCREFSNTERPRHIWSDPYGWVGEFRDVCDADAAVEFRNEWSRLIGMVEEMKGALENYAADCDTDPAGARLGMGWTAADALSKCVRMVEGK